jgi:predicted transcriptional regulator
MKHRSEIEITALILEAVNSNNSNSSRATQTAIMYKAFLSYVQLKKYLLLLMEKGLLEYQKVQGVYRTTEKGKHFLRLYNSFHLSYL